MRKQSSGCNHFLTETVNLWFYVWPCKYSDPPIFLPCCKTGGPVINTIQDGPFRSCSWMGGQPPLPKICHAYPTMMKLGTVIPYLKQIQKIYESRDTPLKFCWDRIFSPDVSKFCYINKYRYCILTHNF